VGIGGVTAPAQKLHVSGTARITGSDGTGIAIVGRDADGDISNLSEGFGINVTGGAVEVDTTLLATQGDLAALGGSGDITDVTVTSPITGGGTAGSVNIAIQQANGSQSGYLSSTDWTTFNNKYTPSGTAGYVPFFATSSSITSQHDFITLNSTGAFKLGLGFLSGGNSQLANYMEAAASGLVVQDDAKAGVGFSTSSSNRWTIYTNTSNELVFNRWGGAAWPTSPWLKLGSTGMLTGVDATFSGLSGSGTRMVVADATGLLSTQTIPGSSVTNLSWSGISSTSATLNSSTGADVIINAGTGVTFAGTTSLTINAASTSGLTHYASMQNSTAGQSVSTFTYNAASASAAAKINYSAVSGNISYTASSGNIIVPASGTYELTFDHNVSCPATTGTTLWSGIYINGTSVTSIGSTASTSTFTTNTNYSHSAGLIYPLTNGDVITIQVKLDGASAAYSVNVTGAKFSIKKLN
jgi:hypothetical protein